MNKRPLVYLFKTYGAYYIYDANKNSIIKTEKRVWNLLKETKCDLKLIYNNENTYEQGIINKLKENGFLSTNRVKEVLHPVDGILEEYLSTKISMMCLQVTQQCNFRCEYCAYSGGYENRGHSNKKMTFEIAKKGIDFLITHSSDLKTVYVGFYGGEPLIEFDLIKRMIEYVNEYALGKKVIFNITTNGTLLDKNIIDFFYRNDVYLLISLDGPKEIHDKSRRFAFNNCGTFDKVMEKISLIKRDFPEYMEKVKFNAVIDPQNDVNCVYKFFNEFEIVKEAFIMHSEILGYYSKKEINYTEKYFEQTGYEYFKLLLSKLNKLDPQYASKFSVKRFSELLRTYHHLKPTVKLPEYFHHGGPCVPGAQRMFLNVDGDFYPCERVSETSPVTKIGDIERGLDINKIREILNIGKLSEEQCKNCWAIRFCSLCVAAADNGHELSKEQKLKSCNGVRRMAEIKLKDICTLKEFGYNFEKDIDVV